METRNAQTETSTAAKLAAVELQTWGLMQKKRFALEAQERGAVESFTDGLLSGVTAPTESKKLTQARAEVAELAAGLASLRNRRILLIEKSRAGKVAEQHAIAEAKRTELADLNSQTDALLKKLSALQSVEFDRSVLHMQLIGQGWANAPRQYCLSAVMTSGTHQPRFSFIEWEIEYAEKVATQLEEQPLPASGSAEGDDLASLLRSVYANPEVITPPIVDVERFHAESLERLSCYEDENFPSPLTKPAGVPHFCLTWEAGKLVERSSYVEAFGARLGLDRIFVLPTANVLPEIHHPVELAESEPYYARRTYNAA